MRQHERTGITRAKDRYFVTIMVERKVGIRKQRKYFDTYEEAVSFKRANKEIVR